MLEVSGEVTMISILKALIEKTDNMQDHTGKFSKIMDRPKWKL